MSISFTGYKLIPDSMFNIVSRQSEIVILAALTTGVAWPLFGLAAALATTVSAITISEAYFNGLKASVAKENDRRYHYEKVASARKQGKAADIIVRSIIAGLCYKVAALAIYFFSSHCCSETENCKRDLSCLALFALAINSVVSVAVSTGYLIKKIIA